jgi:FkbM family methyltransferase
MLNMLQRGSSHSRQSPMQTRNSKLVGLARMLVPRAIRNALRRPSVTAGRIFSKLSYRFGGVAHVTMRQNWIVICHPLAETLFNVFVDDPAQSAEMDEFIQHCSPGMQLVDVGAHWGVFSLAAVRYGCAPKNVIAIEASPEAMEVLKVNLGLNGAESVHVVCAAAGAHAGELEMLTTGAGGADYFVVPEETRSDTVRVKQVTISELCDKFSIAPTHLKIDVEGFEEEVLQGAFAIIRKLSPIIFLELHGDMIRRRHKDPTTVLNQLTSLGYHHWQQQGKKLTLSMLEAENFNGRFVCLPARQ